MGKKPLPLPPTREERLAQEARAARIIQEAQALAETKFQAILGDTLEVEALPFIREEVARVRAWLRQTRKPYFSTDEKVLAGAFLTWPNVAAMLDSWLIERIAERITQKRYLGHLVAMEGQALANEREPAKKPGRKSKEFSLGPELLKLIEPIKKALQAKGLLGEQGQFIIGKSTHIKALYNVLIYKGKIPKKGYDEKFASFFRESFGFSISGRTLRNPPNIGQEEEEQDFKALF